LIFTKAYVILSRPTYNAGPFKHLPVAFMRPRVMSEQEEKELEEEQARDDEEVKESGFIPNFDGKYLIAISMRQHTGLIRYRRLR